MQAKHSLEFARAPAVWSMYPKIMIARKPALVPDGGAVPRIEARLAKVAIDRRHLAAYAQVCGAAAGTTLPIAYPHVLATPLHLAMLGAEAFPVKLFGLVHVHNRIAMRQPLSAEEPAEIRTWIEGHRETERGQEFDLHSEYVVAGEPLWDETCTFLARKRPPPGATRSNLSARSAEGAPDAVAVKSSSFRAPAGLGRRYGFISGDVNPIHMSDLTARAFGFPRAIAHGMWSLGRVASDFEAEQFDGGCELSVTFKLPIYMPAWLMLQRWPIENGSGFALRDAQGEKPHLTGTLKSLR
ncbi:MAG TPA: MaoC/PaaZ C-terminal domain-containing protein [Steroidobacteraceae bacterium]|nr:MaoC/PaaZ C-terminal domain-containing protein [Steroidobacteraceae bacterium]